jgi:drug/metabolite transporter (DMT)-like permease
MAVIWGVPYLLIRVAVRELDPGVVVFLRTAPAAVILTPLVVARQQLGVMLGNIKWIAIFAVVEFGVPWYLMSTAEKHITSSLTSLIICGVPLFAVVAQRIRRTEDRIAPRRYVGLGIGALGVASLVGFDLHGGNLAWIGCMLLVCVGYTVGPIILAQKLQDVEGPTVVMGATAVVALGWLPWSVTHWPAYVSRETWTCVAVLSVVCTVGAFLVFYQLVREVGASRAVVVTYFNTAIAVVLGVVGLHEPLTTGIVLGFPLVLVGCVIATSTPRTTVIATSPGTAPILAPHRSRSATSPPEH